jgi:NADH dehydrogenase
MHRVVIIGAGFGGLEAAKALAKAPVEVTVVDRSNHHLFQPLLYQVATAGLAAPAIAMPIRHILRGQRNATVLMEDVERIDPRAKLVHCAGGATLAYDSLIVAAGATHSYFGHDEWAGIAPGLKTLADATRIRSRILDAFEQAEREPEHAEKLLTLIVIGGGPTGVEMAGTMAEVSRETLRREFRRIRPEAARVILIEGSDRVLGAYSEDLSAKALQQLHSLGVETRLSARVTAIDAEGVMIGDERLPARTVVWAAGVQASPLGKSLGVPLDRAGRVPVEADLRVSGYDGLYVVGDLAAATSDGQPVPGVSPAAKQMGRRAAANIVLGLQGKPGVPFHYRDYGSVATIGRARAIAHVGPVKLSGLPAWLFWLFIHIYFLIGFRNRLMVMADWAFAYFSFSRSARIIDNAQTGAQE